MVKEREGTYTDALPDISPCPDLISRLDPRSEAMMIAFKDVRVEKPTNRIRRGVVY